MRRLFPFALLATLSPATAEDRPPLDVAGGGQDAQVAQDTQGGVARFYLSHQLYSLGMANKDALTVLNAARLAASVVLTDTPRAPEANGETHDPLPLQLPSPDRMFDAAAMLSAQDDDLLDLVDGTRREASFIPTVTVVSTTSALAPAQTATWHLPFFGTSLAELAIIGEAASTLDLRVSDENGNPVCAGAGHATAHYCRFFPAENANFQIQVTNIGSMTTTYVLLTN